MPLLYDLMTPLNKSNPVLFSQIVEGFGACLWTPEQVLPPFTNKHEQHEKVYVCCMSVGAWVHICMSIVCMWCILFWCCVITLSSLIWPLGGDGEAIPCWGAVPRRHGTECTEHSVQMHRSLFIIYMHTCHTGLFKVIWEISNCWTLFEQHLHRIVCTSRPHVALSGFCRTERGHSQKN